ncbi:MAG: sugar phosphate isomerase/epimerase family protein [Anaerolineae bacterium]
MSREKVLERLVASPACNPDMSLDDALAAYAGLGFRKFEVFTGWAKSAFDIDKDPEFYLDQGAQYGMRFTSFHLPPIEDDQATSLNRAVSAARFAQAIGAHIVLYKATSRPNYIEAAARFLDAIEGLDVVPVVQNHYGTPVTTLEDVKEVHEGIDDARMKALLEVGHFHSAGVHWREAADYLGDRVVLVHIKDQIGRQSVPYGSGEIDLPGLFKTMHDRGYRGDYVVEMEVEDREHTLAYLDDAIDYIVARWPV